MSVTLRNIDLKPKGNGCFGFSGSLIFDDTKQEVPIEDVLVKCSNHKWEFNFKELDHRIVVEDIKIPGNFHCLF